MPESMILTCADVNEAVELFTTRLGFRLEMIFPADEPAVAIISGHGVTIRLGKADLSAECGVRTAEWQKETGVTDSRFQIPHSQLPLGPLISRIDQAKWVGGRAGMEYRDLIPSRLGGKLIASHIRIAEAGVVPDYVHYHKVAFQMIYCRRGRVRVVYEDCGEPFWLEPGDCVLQPPEIRHRVLESAANTEVIELTSPAVHETWADHDLELPNGRVDPDRIFNGQRFVHHRSADSTPTRGGFGEFEVHDLGIAAASNGAADAFELRTPGGHAEFTADGEDPRSSFFFLLDGTAKLAVTGVNETDLTPDDAILIPPETEFSISAPRNSRILCGQI